MRHCIIGAGFAGLPVAKRLKELGEDFDVLDRNTGVGGLWHTGVYRDAHIISSKLTTQYPDLPMPADYPDFPAKDQMQRYFEGYVRRFSQRTLPSRVERAAIGAIARPGRRASPPTPRPG